MREDSRLTCLQLHSVNFLKYASQMNCETAEMAEECTIGRLAVYASFFSACSPRKIMIFCQIFRAKLVHSVSRSFAASVASVS